MAARTRTGWSGRRCVALTLAVNLALYAITATSIWVTEWYPPGLLVPLPAAGFVGTMAVGALLLLAVRGWRRSGIMIVLTTLSAAALEVALSLVLLLAYGQAHPGWTFS